MMAELFGRATGACQGKGGSMHIAVFSVDMLGACWDAAECGDCRGAATMAVMPLPAMLIIGPRHRTKQMVEAIDEAECRSKP